MSVEHEETFPGHQVGLVERGGACGLSNVAELGLVQGSDAEE